jgi:hypothetical protein
MTQDDVDQIIRELLDDDSRSYWDLWALWWAPRVLRLVDDFGFPAQKLDAQRLASARAAKATGPPLWQWAEEYRDG